MKILLCTEVEEQFSSYMDGTLSGIEMVDVQEHMRHCKACTRSFAHWRGTLSALEELGPAKMPPSLSLRLRVALSHEKARTPAARLERLRVSWDNTFAPLMVQLSAGFASSVLLLGTVLLLVGTFVTPEQAAARDQPMQVTSPPRLLYVSLPDGSSPVATINGSVIVRVFVDDHGRVYDYHLISGAIDTGSRVALANEMMWSVFEPAYAFGDPVRGSVILSLAGISVPG